MRFVYFTHSIISCWNNGNVHFQRGVLSALQRQGHGVIAFEPEHGWSRQNLMEDQGEAAVSGFKDHYPLLPSATYRDIGEVEEAVQNADVVIVHEWNDPDLVSTLGRLRRQSRFLLLFHDTHHRAISDPASIRHFDLSAYDAVLAFGAALARIYDDWGWGSRAFTWHEAADTAVFHPPTEEGERKGAIWVGNWGDGERSQEIENFLLQPAARSGISLDVHGVRYPTEGLLALRTYGAHFGGWIANIDVPLAFARHRFTVHVPRRFYTQTLPGIPTIRIFEALACGIPLVSAPWEDCENLFRPGTDYLLADTPSRMETQMRRLCSEPDLCAALAKEGLSRILAHHSCDVRAGELLAIVARLQSRSVAA